MVPHTDGTILYIRTHKQSIHSFKITENDLPPSIQKLCNSSFVFRLHKDTDNLLKLRPIAVEGGLKRLVTLCISKYNVDAFTEFLIPYNYAIGIKGGANCIHRTIINTSKENTTK